MRARQRVVFQTLLEALSFWRKGSDRSVANTEQSEYDNLNMAGTYNDTYQRENIHKDYSRMKSAIGKPKAIEINQIMPMPTGNHGSSSNGVSNGPQYSRDRLQPLRHEGTGSQSVRSNFSYYSPKSRLSNGSVRSRVSNRSAFGNENTHQLRRPESPIQTQKLKIPQGLPKMPPGFARGLTAFAMGVANGVSMEGKRSDTGDVASPNK